MRKQTNIKTQQELYYERKNKIRDNIKSFIKGCGEFGLLILIGCAGAVAFISIIGGIAFFFSLSKFANMQKEIERLKERPIYTQQKERPKEWGIFTVPITNNPKTWIITNNWIYTFTNR